MTDPIHRRLRAPTEDGAALVDPPLAHAGELVKQNRALSADWRYDCQGRRLESMVFDARAELCEKARRFTCRYRDIRFAPALTTTTPFILAGHQPELFHPGVWYKNFLLSALARKSKAIAVNLIVDTDLVRNAAIAVPVKQQTQATVESVAYDASGDTIPYEERAILDSWLFQSFSQRVEAAYKTCRIDGHEPYTLLLNDLWKSARLTVQEQIKDPRLGLVLAEMRHRLETQLGLTTLEVPLSAVARTRVFRWFTLHLLAQLPRFWRIYNVALAEYRHVNRIRSLTHPVPSLQEHHDWLESPFFIWTNDNPRRRHLFAHQLGKSLILTDRQGLQLQLDMTTDGPPDNAIEQLAEAEAKGIKIRPRALITTMYARLMLSDLFIHGIGGAKYDELTDLIIRRFFGIEPPAYVTATATFRLPIERPEVTLEDLRTSAQRLRDLRFRPESFATDSALVKESSLRETLQDLATEKRNYLWGHKLRRGSRYAFAGLDRLNKSMYDLLAPVEEEMRATHTRLVEQAEQARVLGSREFSFVLFPSEILPARLLDLCKVSS